MPARKPRPNEKPQSERFIETARAIGADESSQAFERVFASVVTSNLPSTRSGQGKTLQLTDEKRTIRSEDEAEKK